MSDSKAGSSSSGAHRADAKGSDFYSDDSKGSHGDHKSTSADVMGGGDGACFADCPRVEVHTIELEPRGCVPIHAPLELKIGFELERGIDDAYWQIQFLVDTTFKRLIVRLGQTERECYPDGLV